MNTDDAPAEDVLRELQFCAFHWEPSARIIGNIRAVDISRACGEAIKAMSRNEGAFEHIRSLLRGLPRSATAESIDRICADALAVPESQIVTEVPTQSPNSGEGEERETGLSL